MSTSNEKQSNPKEPYQAPALTVYGTIRDITKGNVSSGRNDMVGGPDKTG